MWNLLLVTPPPKEASCPLYPIVKRKGTKVNQMLVKNEENYLINKL